MSLPPLYAVVDGSTARARGWEVVPLARAYVDGGARLLQVRAPECTGQELLAWCEDIVALAHPVGGRVIVNDRADIARLAGADGVHVGQTDLEVAAVRQILPEPALVGLSTHSRRQVDEVPAAATYVAVGPVFATRTKATGYAPVGTALVRYAATSQPRPVVAIGGVTLDRAPAILAAGAAAVAVVSDLLEGGDPAQRVADYVAALTGGPK